MPAPGAIQEAVAVSAAGPKVYGTLAAAAIRVAAAATPMAGLAVATIGHKHANRPVAPMSGLTCQPGQPLLTEHCVLSIPQYLYCSINIVYRSMGKL